jgi:hypothetical protein
MRPTRKYAIIGGSFAFLKSATSPTEQNRRRIINSSDEYI